MHPVHPGAITDDMTLDQVQALIQPNKLDVVTTSNRSEIYTMLDVA